MRGMGRRYKEKDKEYKKKEQKVIYRYHVKKCNVRKRNNSSEKTLLSTSLDLQSFV